MGKKSKVKRKGGHGSQKKQANSSAESSGSVSGGGGALAQLVIGPHSKGPNENSVKLSSASSNVADREVLSDQTNKAYLTLPAIKSLQSTPLASSSAADIEVMDNSTEENSPKPSQIDDADTTAPKVHEAHSEPANTNTADLNISVTSEKLVDKDLSGSGQSSPTQSTPQAKNHSTDNDFLDENSTTGPSSNLDLGSPLLKEQQSNLSESRNAGPHGSTLSDSTQSDDNVTSSAAVGVPSMMENIRPESPQTDTMTSGASFVSADENIDQEITHIHSASYEASGDLSDRFDTPQGTRQAAAGETTPKLSYVLARVSAPGTDTPTAKADNPDTSMDKSETDYSKSLEEVMETPQNSSISGLERAETGEDNSEVTELNQPKSSPPENSESIQKQEAVEEHEEETTPIVDNIEAAEDPTKENTNISSEADNSISVEDMETRELSAEETEVVNALDTVVNGAMDSTEPTETPAVSEPETTEQNQEVVESEAAPPAAEADSKASAEATEPKAETEDKQEASAASEEPAAAGGDNSAAAASSKPEITPAAIVEENKTSGDKTEDNKEAGDVEKEPETKTNTEESKPKTEDGSIELTESQKSKSKASPSGPVEQGCCTIL